MEQVIQERVQEGPSNTFYDPASQVPSAMFYSLEKGQSGLHSLPSKRGGSVTCGHVLDRQIIHSFPVESGQITTCIRSDIADASHALM